MQPRPYQTEALRAIVAKLAEHRSTLLEMATGLGKTVCFAHLADEWPGRVLVIAHRDELIRQAAEKISAVTGRCVAVEMGRERAGDELYGTKVTVASVQTLARAKRRARFHPDHFSLVVIDEGHHAAAVSYREVMDYFASAKRLLVTATPKRADKVGLDQVCESVAFQYGIEPAITDGWLVPIRQQIVQVQGLDFSKVRTVAQDFNQADLEKVLTEEEQLHRMVGSAVQIVGQRQTLWFCTSVAHAKATKGVLTRYTEERAEFLSGDTPAEERREKVDAFRAGAVRHLVSCMLFCEGFDAPSTSALVMARPTKSLALYTQMIGRGTRPLPGTVDGIELAQDRRAMIAMSEKPDVLVIDYAGNAGKHKIVQAGDVLEGKNPLPVREYAAKTVAEEGAAVDLEEALDRAREELALEEEEQERRRRIRADRVEYVTAEVSPFVRQQANGRAALGVPAGEGATDKQVRYILYLSRQLGHAWDEEAAAGLGKRQAGAVIDKMRKELGL